MSQSDFGTINPSTKSGSGLASDLNGWRDAVHSNHKGVARPAYAASGMTWIKEVSSSLWEVYLYDGDTDIFLRSVNPSTNEVIPLTIAQGGTNSATASDARTALGLAIGSAVQAYNAILAALAGLSASANQIAYFTGASSLALTSFTSAARTFCAAVDAAAQRAALSLGSAALKNTGTSGDAVGLLNTANSYSAAQSGTPVSLTQAATIAVNLALGNHFHTTMTGNRTLGAPSNMTPGQSGTIEIIQDGTGNRTLAYNAAWLFPGGADPVLSTAANAKDLLCYQVNQAGTAVYANLLKGFA